MLYGSECCQQEKRHIIVETKMVGWMSGHTRQDRTCNECIREKVRVAPIMEKISSYVV